MKLKKIRITNYRSCIETEFMPDRRLSALIGPNGTGKTNVLEAIRLLQSLLYSHHGSYRPDEMPRTSTSEIKSWFDINGKSVIHTAKLNLYTDEHNHDEIIGSDEKWYMRDITGNKKLLKLPIGILPEFLLERNNRPIFASRHVRQWYMMFGRHAIGLLSGQLSVKVIDALKEISEFIYHIKYYSASQFTDPSRCPISFEVEKVGKDRRGISITGHNRFLFDMYQQYRAKTAGYKEYISLVNQEGIGLLNDINFEEIQVSSSEYSVMTGGSVRKRERVKVLVVPQFIVGNSKLSPSQLSEGTFKTLALLFYLVTETSSLLMIEEPEVCIHHGLLSSIVELVKIYSKEKQIIISTHSDAVLDELDIPNVFKVTKGSKSGTKIVGITHSLKRQELRALKDFLRTEGTLGEYWKHGDLEDG